MKYYEICESRVLLLNKGRLHERTSRENALFGAVVDILLKDFQRKYYRLRGTSSYKKE